MSQRRACLTSRRPWSLTSQRLWSAPWSQTSQRLDFFSQCLNKQRPHIFGIEIYMFCTSSQRMGFLPWCLTSQRPHVFGNL